MLLKLVTSSRLSKAPCCGLIKTDTLIRVVK
jgi:hypothetical protein